MSRIVEIGVANVGGAAKPPLDRFLKGQGYGHPRAILLSEAYWCGRYARRWGRRNGYRFVRYSAVHGWEARSVAALIKEDVKRKSLIKLTEPWWWRNHGSQTLRKRKPRRILKVKDDGGLKVASVHNVPGGPGGGTYSHTGKRNAAAWAEGIERYKRLLDRGHFVGGDFNGDRGEVLAALGIGGERYAPTGRVGGLVLPKNFKHIGTSNIRDGQLPGHGWGIVRVREI